MKNQKNEPASTDETLNDASTADNATSAPELAQDAPNPASVDATPTVQALDTAKVIAELEAKAAENLNLAKYQKAEFENYKRRTQNAVAAAFQDGQSNVVKMLLPIFDGVVEAGKKIADPADLAGFEIIRKQLDNVFTQLGIEAIAAKDQPFDPKLHNAVSVEKVEGQAPDMVLEEWQTGFTWHGQVLRPAMVKVSGA